MPNKLRKRVYARTETLLRRLAQTATSEKIKLRAIELLLMTEGKLKQSQLSDKLEEPRNSELSVLADTEQPETNKFNLRSVGWTVGDTTLGNFIGAVDLGRDVTKSYTDGHPPATNCNA